MFSIISNTLVIVTKINGDINNYNMSQVAAKTLIHELVNTKFTNNSDLQIASVEQSNAFETYKDELELYIEFQNSKQKTDPILSEVDFWKNNLDKISSLETEFQLYWIDQYNSTHPKVKEELQNTINIEDTILQSFSDCMGCIFRIDENIDSRYIPVNDTNADAYLPSPFPSTLEDKLSINISKNSRTSNTQCSALFNRAMNTLYDGSTQDQPHQSDLSTDYYHIKRIVENKPELMQIVAERVEAVFDIMVYLMSYKYNNLQKTFSATFDIDVEGQFIKVDTLGNKIQGQKTFNTKTMIV